MLTREQAINRCCSGPVARASGVPRDLRKDEPYLAYRDFDFQVCCARAGDTFARYLVRMEEMRESLQDRAAGGGKPAVPDRSMWALDERTTLPSKPQVYQTIEGTITHFELVMANRGFEVPARGIVCGGRGAQRRVGLLPGRATAAMSPIEPAADLRRSSTSHCFPMLIRGHTVSDVVAILGSLNIIAAELDR